jgi:hypothetical protein
MLRVTREFSFGVLKIFDLDGNKRVQKSLTPDLSPKRLFLDKEPAVDEYGRPIWETLGKPFAVLDEPYCLKWYGGILEKC